jgi:ribosome-binding ATPase YchF (GTP1/OBG family)
LDEDLTEDDKEQEKQNLEVKTWNTISMLISKQVFMVENKQSNSIKNKHVEHVTENEEVIKKHVASVMATEELLRQAKVFLVQFNKQ